MKNNYDFIKILNILYLILYIIIALIKMSSLYNNWQEKYIQISQVGYEAQSFATSLGWTFIVLCIPIILILNPEEKGYVIMRMSVIIIILMNILSMLNSWA